MHTQGALERFAPRDAEPNTAPSHPRQGQQKRHLTLTLDLTLVLTPFLPRQTDLGPEYGRQDTQHYAHAPVGPLCSPAAQGGNARRLTKSNLPACLPAFAPSLPSSISSSSAT